METQNGHTSIYLDAQTRQTLDEMAQKMNRSRSSVIKLLIARAAPVLLLDGNNEPVKDPSPVS